MNWAMPKSTLLRVALAVAVSLTALPARAQDAPKPPPGPYKIQPGDEVAVSILPQKEYDAAGIVLPDGMVYFKNIGGLKAGGRTFPELADDVRKSLDEILVNPRVTVSLVRMAPKPEKPEKPEMPVVPVKPEPIKRVTVVGAVLKPGPLELEEGLRIRKAIDLAGGVDEEADLTQISVVHKNLTRTTVDLSTAERVSDPAHNRILAEGDSIEIPRKPMAEKGLVRVTGEVLKPGQYELKPEMALEDLIVEAGKLTLVADVERVQLQRRGQPLREINLAKEREKGIQGVIPLRAGDQVYIPGHASSVVMLGALAAPGRRAFTPGQTVRDFFVQAGPQTAQALNPALVDLKGVQLIRTGVEPRTINLTEAIKKSNHKDNVALQNGDVLFFPATKGPKKGVLDYVGQLGPLGFLLGL